MQNELLDLVLGRGHERADDAEADELGVRQVPLALRQLGIEVSTIDAEQLASGDLDRFDAIVTGIRAYEVNAELIALNRRLLAYAEQWRQPEFPIRGRDLAGLGIDDGPRMGQLLRELEKQWVDGGFSMDRGALLNRAATMLRN